MMWFMFLLSVLKGTPARCQEVAQRHPKSRRNPAREKRPVVPCLEVLEGRLCPSSGYLLVNSVNSNSVLRYDETTGAFVDTFVPPRSGGLLQPCGLVFGRDHNLYVT